MEYTNNDRKWMDMARILAKAGTCIKQQVGVVIVDHNDTLLAVGYNGNPEEMGSCYDVEEKTLGAALTALTSLDTCSHRNSAGRHKWLLHAEERAIVAATRYGVSLTNAVAYCTHLPCPHCMALFAEAGVDLVIWSENNLGPDRTADTEEVVANSRTLMTVQLEAK